ncbi:MAG: hypothetical protein HZB53_13470 [Chloroflexi bacterium]|nr:hypothetical protein [Chloroflexota bacterium]
MKSHLLRLSLVAFLGLLLVSLAGLRPALAASAPGGETPDVAFTYNMTPTVGAHVEFKGTVEAVGANSLTVNGKAVTTDANTKFKPNVAAVVVGAMVEVDGVYQADLTILATEVEVKQASGEFKGLIESFGATQWVVGGKTFVIDANTQIKGTPVAGRMAEVKYAKQPDGSLLALKIEVNSSKPRRFEFTGVLKAMGATEWKVGTRVVQVSPSTIIKGTPAVGRYVTVKGSRSGTTWMATYVKVGRMAPARFRR